MKDGLKVFLVRAGRKAEREDYCLENNIMVVGFTEFPSFEGAKDFEEILEIIKKTKPGIKTRAAGNYAGQLWSFVVDMKEGDIVVLPRKHTSQIALGEVTGPYKYKKVEDKLCHTRAVKWIRPNVPRTAFGQDLLYSFGAYLTVCKISRNDAVKRVQAVFDNKPDPGPSFQIVKQGKGQDSVVEHVEDASDKDLAQAADDQIQARIQGRFCGHGLATLVDAVLKAEGWETRLSPPGADGGVDILAGRGSLGLDHPRLCVQVKSQNSPADVSVYRGLQASMQSFKADQGLLVCWGGFNKALLNEAKQGHFSVRLWDSKNLVDSIYKNYEKLPAEIQADLPLKKVWMLVTEELDD